MRRVRYVVAASLDGYIAGLNGEWDWIVHDPDKDFGALFRQFDTALVGRRTYDMMVSVGNTKLPGLKMIVFSRTLRQADHPGVTVVSQDAASVVAEVKSEPGKDMWLFGGGQVFRSLLDAHLVDTVEIAVVPVLLGGGIPLLPPPASRTPLKLTGHMISANGIVTLEYSIGA